MEILSRKEIPYCVFKIEIFYGYCIYNGQKRAYIECDNQCYILKKEYSSDINFNFIFDILDLIHKDEMRSETLENMIEIIV